MKKFFLGVMFVIVVLCISIVSTKDVYAASWRWWCYNQCCENDYYEEYIKNIKERRNEYKNYWWWKCSDNKQLVDGQKDNKKKDEANKDTENKDNKKKDEANKDNKKKDEVSKETENSGKIAKFKINKKVIKIAIGIILVCGVIAFGILGKKYYMPLINKLKARKDG